MAIPISQKDITQTKKSNKKPKNSVASIEGFAEALKNFKMNICFTAMYKNFKIK